MWYGDTIWPSLIGIGSIAAVALMLWHERRRPLPLIVALLCIPAALGAILVERRIVTPREQVIARLEQLLRDFEAGSTDAVVDAVSIRSPELKGLAARASDRVKIANVRLTDINVEISGEDVLRARMHFRVSADVIFNGLKPFARHPTRWNSTWEQEADQQWRLIDLDQLDPLTGESTHEARQYVN